MRQRNGTDPREETEADLKPKTEKERRQLVVAFVFFLQVTVIGAIGREEEQKLSRTHHFSGKSRRRVKQRAAITVPTRHQLFLPPIPVQKGSLAISGVLRTVL
jgi:hypothetical protein